MPHPWDPEDIQTAPEEDHLPAAEDAAVALIRARGRAGRAEHRATIDRADLPPAKWLAEHQAELADALVYSVRLSDALELLETAYHLISSYYPQTASAVTWKNAYRTRYPAP